MTSLDERHPIIKPRRVTFDWSGVPLHWLGGNAYTTHMMNSLQLLLPRPASGGSCTSTSRRCR